MPVRVEFFFDYGSPFSYLADALLPGLAARTRARFEYRPMLLGGVFKATGNEMPARIPAKARWMLHDMTLWSHHYGVPFRVPSRFPLVTLRTQRALAGVERSAAAGSLPAFALALFDAYWAQDQDVSTDPVIGACATRAGLDAAAVIAAIDAPETKDQLRATTEEAVRRGAFGAPAMFVGDALFWGNDRIPLLEKYLATL
jgi:2-hydroxychromene-2-carboxylate isomerase